MTGILAIGPNEREHIEIAIAAAKAKPVPWEALQATAQPANPSGALELKDRINADAVARVRREYPSQHVQLGTYRCALTFEQQPSGLMRHLSISTLRPGTLPGEDVIAMVVEAFGFSGFPPFRPYNVWLEEFEPGHHAVNIVELEPT